MICFGTAVGPRDTYERLALPSIRSVAESDAAILVVRGALSITSAYNALIDQALELSDVEALVLMHDDVVIQDRNFRARIHRIFRDPTVGVIGVIGGRRLRAMGYWTAEQRVGRAWDGGGFHAGNAVRGDVDAVDGLLMVLSRRALDEIRFDEKTFRGFHGYDSDFCLTCRQAGLRVVVEPFHVFHQSSGDHLSEGFLRAEKAFVAKWKDQLASSRSHHPHVLTTQRRIRRLRMAFAPGMDELRSTTVAALGRLRPHTRPDRKTQVTPPGGDLLPPATSEPPPPCTACGAATHLASRTLPVAVCEACGLGRTWPDPQVYVSSREIFEIAYRGRREAERSAWTSQAEKRISWMETLVPEGLVLELGSATGEFVNVAAAHGYEAYGVEPSAWAARIAQEAGADVVSGTLCDWMAEYEGFSVDAIVMFHVLEHLESPTESLHLCLQLLTDGGTLFIEVPNGSSRQARALDHSWLGWSFRFHRWHFTPQSLQRLLEDAGFEVVELLAMTDRPYASSRSWETARAADRAAGHTLPNLDFLRVCARRPPMIG